MTPRLTERLFSSVSPNVCLQIVGLAEAFSADCAAVRLFTLKHKDLKLFVDSEAALD